MTQVDYQETRASRWMARNYDRIAATAERAITPIRADLLGPVTGRVLEVGAGTGENLAHYRSAAEVVAVEPSPTMRGRLHDKLDDSSSPIEVVDAVGERLPFPDGSFDAVVCTLVLCMVPDLDGTLTEIRRVLKPGGRLVFFEHVRGEGLRGSIQDLLTPLMRRLLFGCRPNRRTLERMRSLGFELCVSHYQVRPWPRPPASSPYFGGVATLRGAKEAKS
ncbi:class I SAM-dependent methyltransferase [Actinomadura rudentiformis]|uniref:Class I SAM-dependent methyltransferase n=1 Tax=Actinomadura rudentiformis TaxID=359158 RepID=A0A6H9YJD7_9ACTN|nr:class I SAM-dependent methyltransferase [Actinomadura rudentiformis]KAB2346953.1 class I SAM-dependent methyltransferase [Actinomadura rudentiformis]